VLGIYLWKVVTLIPLYAQHLAVWPVSLNVFISCDL